MNQLSSRRSPRVDFRVDLMLRAEQRSAAPIAARTRNLGQGGMFVIADDLWDVGTPVDFFLPLADAAVLMQGRVAWARQHLGRASRPRGMGIEFVDLTLDSRQLLQRAIQRLPAQSQEVTLHLEDTPPIRARALVLDDGIRLSTRLPFLRLHSQVTVSLREGHAADGTIRRVHLLSEAAEGGVPQLEIEVGLENARLERKAGNENRSVSGAFETRPPLATPGALRSPPGPVEGDGSRTPHTRGAPAAAKRVTAKVSRGEPSSGATRDAHRSPDLSRSRHTLVRSRRAGEHDVLRSRRLQLWLGGAALIAGSTALLSGILFAIPSPLTDADGASAVPTAGTTAGTAPQRAPDRKRSSGDRPASAAVTPASQPCHPLQTHPPERDEPSPSPAPVPPSASRPSKPSRAVADADRRVVVTIGPDTARLELQVVGSTGDHHVYPLADPPGVAVFLPAAEPRIGLGRHPVREGPFGSLLVVRAGQGTRTLLFFRDDRRREARVAFVPGRLRVEVDP